MSVVRMPGADKETDLSERIEAFLAELKRSGSGSGSVRGSAETARDTAALLRKITAQARWSSAGVFPVRQHAQQHHSVVYTSARAPSHSLAFL